ncbi:tetratricopeptide repeat domain-containing protein [Nannizzia gypsea CBS 118893]|uniref:Tetratricopeptide repeat domain-containing protein n=1 Tax=Arthroderma gypseum (strain ATCC MYA-4604 / CBS 118893) TaxID=535722 RepID=E5QZ04_ARTGP|nr:tetratricopeptide repeat domain-containing protein [Nannizzia gypsea CBS 118893]EFQ98913.1 tetratricopeptide repeat domain-containing protein [Nannizzia gypsea CBS 118893]
MGDEIPTKPETGYEGTTAEVEAAAGAGAGAGADQKKGELAQLVKLATANEAAKDYGKAVDLYSQAAGLQAEINGDMAPENADILYSYGKCLYHVGVSKSDVLGAKMPQTATEPAGGSSSKPGKKSGSGEGAEELSSSIIKDAIAKQAETGESAGPSSSRGKAGATPLFQFIGDENLEASDDDDEDEDGEGEGEGDEEGKGDGEEEEDDDFANAFEILDLSRVLYERQRSELEQDKEKNEEKLRRVKERLADTYDLQAEISLEGERFPDAATDLQSSLRIKEELYSAEDPIIAECYYKLSLAMEFSSVMKKDGEGEEGEEEKGKASESSSEEPQYDAAAREQAAVYMEKAIKSCKGRIAKEEARIESIGSNDGEAVAKIKRNIEDVRDIVLDMEQRLVDLRRPPVAIPNAERTKEEQAAAQAIKLEELTKVANDLTGLVKKKKPAAPAPAPAVSSTAERQPEGKGKRPLESAEEEMNPKKVKGEESS